MRPPESPAASRLSPSAARQSTRKSTSSRASSAPVFGSQRRMVLSVEPEARRPSGSTASALTGRAWPSSLASSWPGGVRLARQLVFHFASSAIAGRLSPSALALAVLRGWRYMRRSLLTTLRCALARSASLPESEGELQGTRNICSPKPRGLEPRRKRRAVNPNGADMFDVTDCLAKKDRCAAWSEKDRDHF